MARKNPSPSEGDDRPRKPRRPRPESKPRAADFIPYPLIGPGVITDRENRSEPPWRDFVNAWRERPQVVAAHLRSDFERTTELLAVAIQPHIDARGLGIAWPLPPTWWSP